MTPQLLIDTVEHVDFFIDKNDREVYYVEYVDKNDVRTFTPLDSEAFKGFLYVKSFELTDGKEVLEPKSAIKQLRYMLAHYKEYQLVDVYRRIAGNLETGIEYDLQNSSRQSVKVTSEGWYVSACEKRFVIPKISLPQVTPIQTDRSPLELLKPFVNVTGDMLILFTTWLVQCFSKGSHYALLISADKGSGKSTMSAMIRDIIDPCSFKVTPIPSRKDDLYALLYNSFLCCFDNLSDISDDESDIFCGAITGSAIAKRSLYTNNELSVATFHNTIVFNGIDFVPRREDLLERMLVLKLQKLKPSELKRGEKLREEFKKALPEILGSVFNTLSSAMASLDDRHGGLQRMTDAFVEMIAIAEVLGVSEERFRQIYADNVEELNTTKLSSPLLKAIDDAFSTEGKRKLSGKAEVVYKKICSSFSGDKNLLPKSASHFSRKLDEQFADLLKAGYRVNIDDTGAYGTEVTIIKKKK